VNNDGLYAQGGRAPTRSNSNPRTTTFRDSIENDASGERWTAEAPPGDDGPDPLLGYDLSMLEQEIAKIGGAHLLNLEGELRAVLRDKHSLYESEKDMLLRIFRDVDDGSGDIDIKEFINLWRKFGVEVSYAETAALFRKHGYEDVMPYDKFAQQLLARPARQMAENLPVRKGAFTVGGPADHMGKIVYKECKSGVFPPTDWDPSLAERASDLPNSRLVLEFVYGYAGLMNSSPNIFYLSTGEIVYYTAAVGIIYSPPPLHKQRFFLGHNDDIKSLAICSGELQHEGVTYPPRTIMASGQVSSHENGPYVCVWDARVGSLEGDPELARITFEKESRGICALGFSPCGTMLTTVEMDNPHTVTIHDWRRNKKLGEGRGHNGEPIQVFGVEWNPYQAEGETPEFLTYGRKHLKRWYEGDNGDWNSVTMNFGKFPMQNVHSVVWLPPKASGQSLVLGGCANGEIYVWKDRSVVKSFAAHAPGPSVIAPDGSKSYSGLRCMRMMDDRTLVTGGADGVIHKWDVSSGPLGEDCKIGEPVKISPPYAAAGVKTKPVALRALDVKPDTEDIVVGTGSCDVWEVTQSGSEVLIFGHNADLYHLAWHPSKPDVFATACESARVFVWDAASRDMQRTCSVGFKARVCAFSSTAMAGDAHHLAVGGDKGDIIVLNESNLQPVFNAKDLNQAVSDIKYSPDGRYMAVASNDTFVDIYAIKEASYSRVSRCAGHSSTVRHLDWASDSSCIQSNSAAYEILYHNPKTGKKVLETQRDTKWDSWTCVLGFPVMGIWPDGSDGTDVNAVCASRDGRYLVTAGDDGLVKLFNFPCVVEDAPHRAYRGHCSHVMCVRINYADRRVCSVGGKDRAVMQFKLTELDEEPEPEPEPEMVWGPLDSAGRTYGWVPAGPSSVATSFATAPHQAVGGRPATSLVETPGEAVPALGLPPPPPNMMLHNTSGLRDSTASSIPTSDNVPEDAASDDDPYQAGGWGA